MANTLVQPVFVDELPAQVRKTAGSRILSADVRELLEANPEQWAAIASYDKQSSAGATAHRLRKDPRYADFEVVTRGNTIYARFAPKIPVAPAPRRRRRS